VGTLCLTTKGKRKKIYFNVRIAPRLHAMIEDLEILLGEDFTFALEWILIDWEKNRYLIEKERLLRLEAIRYEVFKREANRKTT